MKIALYFYQQYYKINKVGDIMYEWLFAGAIVFTAAVLQSAVGFGFAVVATPLLLMVFDSRDVIQISILLSAAIALLLLPKIIKEVDAVLLKRLFVGSLFGIPVGLFFFAYVSLNIIKLTVGIVVILIGAFLFFWGLKNSAGRRQPDSGSASGGRAAELSVGLLSGVLTAGIGMPGIPLSIYFNLQNTAKAVVRSTTLAFFIGVYTVTVIGQMLTVKFSSSAVTGALLLAPALVTGIVVGNILHYRLNQRLFQLIINIVLLYTGISMVVKVL